MSEPKSAAFAQEVEVSRLVWANNHLRHSAVSELLNQLAIGLRRDYGFISERLWHREGLAIQPNSQTVKVFLYAA